MPSIDSARFAVVLTLIVGCSDGEPDGGEPDAMSRADAALPDATPPPRIVPVGLNIVPLNYDTGEAAWRQVFAAAEEAGVDLVALYGPGWAETEIAPGVFDWGPDADGFFAALDSHDFPRRMVDVNFPVGWIREALPADLEFTSFRDPVLIQRYKGYLTDAIGRLGNRVSHVIVHTEGVDAYTTMHPERLADICALVAEAADHIHATFPNVRVGAYQLDAPVAASGRLACLSQPMDFVTVAATCDASRPASDFRDQLDRGLALADGKPIVIYEASCPTSSYIGSSEALQVEVVHDLFDFLEEHRDVELVSVYQVFDEDKTITRLWVEAQFPDADGWTAEFRENLIEWASSLGLRTHLDEPKDGWDAFTGRLGSRAQAP